MTNQNDRHTGHSRRRAASTALAAAITLCCTTLTFTPTATAGTYPMYQCTSSLAAVSPGWSVIASETNASTILTDTCSVGGSISDYVFTNKQAGIVTENAGDGSSVGLAINVPASTPGITIHAIQANVTGSAVTGNDAFLVFTSDGQSLPGKIELPYDEGRTYTTTDSWTLPQGAQDFEANVYCTNDRNSPTCDFTESTDVPALNNITLTLEDNTPPAIENVSGPLVTAAAAHTPVTGSQPISFTTTDSGSGVQTATMTLNPLNGGASYTHTLDFSTECAYDSWNACPLTQTVSSYTLNTTPLANGTYDVTLSSTDAAGNTTNDALGSITINNTTPTVSSLGAQPGPGTTNTTPEALTPALTPNGSGATAQAHIELGERSTISRTYAKRALQIAGRLLNAQGTPIAGASLDVLQQINGAALELISHIQTTANGTFTSTIPAGASRTIEIGYRAFSDDSNYSTTATITESVHAGVQLNVSRHITSSHGPITLSGNVLGPVPAQGVVVEILVHYRGQWQPIRYPRTEPNGHFHAVYKFQGAFGRFPFRALVFSNQSAFPFATGESKPVDVITR